MSMDIYVRDTKNDMIKTSEIAGLESVVDSTTQRFLISDTTLRSFIPPQFRKMNPILHHICGCEIFIIPKNTHIDLNIFRTKIVSYLQHNFVGR